MFSLIVFFGLKLVKKKTYGYLGRKDLTHHIFFSIDETNAEKMDSYGQIVLGATINLNQYFWG